MSTHQRGRAHEELAARELERRGYRVVARNYRCRAGEIDLICRHRGALVFVEVRSRTSGERGGALATVSPAKRRRIARVAEHYLATQQPDVGDCRFDVVGITGRELTVVVDAFRLGELS